jgi:hypothetical protein
MFKYRVVLAEIYKQGYELQSDKELTKEEAIDIIFNEGIDPIPNDFEYSQTDFDESTIELKEQ